MSSQSLFFLIILGFMISSCSAGAQSKLKSSDLKPKQKALFQQAKSEIRISSFESAIEKLDKLIAKSPDFLDAYILKADALFKMKSLPEATTLLEYTISKDSLYAPISYLKLGQIYQEKLDIEMARKNYKAFIRHGNSENFLIRAKKALIQLTFIENAMNNPVEFNPEKLSPTINGSPSSESLPLITVDGKVMIFTRRSNGQEDLLASRMDQNGEWLEAEPLSAINSPQNEAAHAISADGRTIIFTGCNRRGGLGGCDLYIVEKKNGNWSEPKNLGAPINGRGWDAQPTLSADGRTLYFSSNRKGGIGGYDIWRAKRRADGKWSVPRNVGPSINTKGNDESPHLHWDGRHLYFMSNGKVGMGDTDLFVSILNNGTWGESQNIGYPINTPAREGALSVSPDGEYGYFTRNRIAGGDQIGKYDDDIYRFKMPEGIKPDPVSFGIFKIIDASTNDLIPASVVVFNTETNSAISSFEYLPTQLSPLIAFAKGNRYGVHVNSPGYVFYSSSALQFDDISINGTDTVTIALSKLIKSTEDIVEYTPVVLNNVFFSSGSAELSTNSFFELDRLVGLLQESDDINIQISGHTDDVGSDNDNLILSQSRAESVRNYLLAKGIDAGRVSALGYGETAPIADNTTDEGRQINRRTEFLIIQN